MKYYVVNAFTETLFGGNPAGVCLLQKPLDDETMQNIAAQNNLSETAFLLKQDGYYDLHWFTPSIEVDLCGHATLASAFVLFNNIEKESNLIKFRTISGIMTVKRDADLLYLDFPSRPAAECKIFSIFEKAFNTKPIAVYKAVDFMVLVDNEKTLRNIHPDFSLLKQIKEDAGIDNDSFGIIVTAKGNDCDFVSRFFAPNAGINEDPVTGRAHCSLIPYWSKRLGKTIMTARQLSKRGGLVYCEDCENQVKIGGKAVCYSIGELLIE